MGHHDGAETAALQALAAGVPGALLERCRLLWACDKGHRAIRELDAPVRRLQMEVAGGLAGLAAAGGCWCLGGRELTADSGCASFSASSRYDSIWTLYLNLINDVCFTFHTSPSTASTFKQQTMQTGMRT